MYISISISILYIDIYIFVIPMCGFEFPRLYTRTHPSPDSRKSFCQIPKVYIIPQASTYDWYISFRKAPGIRVLMRQSFRLTPAIYDETFRSPARIRVLFYGNTLLKWHVYDLDAYCKRRRNQRKQANIIEAFVLRVCEWAYCPMDQTRKIEEGGGGRYIWQVRQRAKSYNDSIRSTQKGCHVPCY